MARRLKAADASARASAPLTESTPAGPRIDHAALFPGLRLRHDGWSPARTQRFLDVLGHTGCVEDACRVAGMSDVGARRMKAKYPAFSDAWDAALDRAQQGLVAIAYKRAVEGRETVIIRKGEEVERRIAPSDSMLAMLVKRGDLAGERAPPDPDKVLTIEEYRDFWRFDDDGRKIQIEDPAISSARVKDKMIMVRERLLKYAEEEQLCPVCTQVWPAKDGRSMAELVASGVVSFDVIFSD